MMTFTSRGAVAAIAGLALLAPAIPTTSVASPVLPEPSDLPAGMPPAVYTAPDPLPEPALWPFGDGFPRTSGVGRVANGATFWSDFLYDDNGSVGATPLNESPGAPSYGGLRYPEPAAHNNGADIFRTAVGATPTDTWWRVDWVTLADPLLPIAAFAIDLDADDSTGVDAWGAGTGLRSAGTDKVLVVSAERATLFDAATGTATDVVEVGGALEIDAAAQSFVVRVPRTVMAVSGTSTVRLAAGLADADGTGFAGLTPEHGWLPGLPTAFNVTFRDYDDEPALHNFWFERTQATTLATGDVSAFALDIDWQALADRVTEPEPIVHGTSNRWYVSSRSFGHGIHFTPQGLRDDTENYLGRVQPYAAYVPTSYDPEQATPLTWMLPAYIVNHNQFTGTAPSFMVEACEQRGALCASPNGRGPDGFYAASAELDFWEVWRDLAVHFTLDVDRTTLGGYSMGGFGTSRLAQNHPHLFAGTYMLASSPEGLYDGLVNLGHVAHYHGHPLADSNVPIDEALAEIEVYDLNGHRYTFDVYPAEDHVEWPIKDDFGDASAWLAGTDHVRTTAPRDVVFDFDPADVDDDLGIGPRHAYWTGDLVARDTSQRARVTGTASSLPGRDVTIERSGSIRPDARPSPAHRRTLAWTLGAPLAIEPVVELSLRNLAAASIDVSAVALDVSADGARIAVDTDGDTALTLVGLPAGTTVRVNGQTISGSTLTVAEGTHSVTFSS